MDGNFPFLIDSSKNSQIYSAKISEFFYRILIGTSVVWVAFHEFSFLISLEATSTVTWLKQKLVAPIILLIAMILERFRYFINELVVD